MLTSHMTLCSSCLPGTDQGATKRGEERRIFSCSLHQNAAQVTRMQNLQAFGVILVVVCFIGVSQALTRIVEPHNEPLFVKSGTAFELKCIQEEGREVTWLKDSTRLSSTTNTGFVIITETTGGKTISNLIKNDTTEADSDNYVCMEKGNPGSSYYVSVKVYDIQTESQKLIPNQDLYLRCNITQINRVTELKWFKIDADGSERKIIPDQDKYKTNDTHNSLTITRAKVKEDAGVYRCEVDLQGTKASEYVYVTSDPWVKPFDKSKNLVQGERLVLTCEVYGYPMPTVSWEKDGEPLKEDDRTSFEAVKNVTNAKLTVQTLDFADRGVYLCNATNSESSQNGSLIVRVKDKLAALWPFLGICAEVAILCIIIFVYEKRRSKQMDEDDAPEKEHMTNSHDHKGTDDVRHRK